jgi:hypothetical protein
MKFRMGWGSMVLAALAVAAPAWARTDAATFDVTRPMTVAGTNVMLQPGHYEFRVKPEDTHLEILKGNKMVADVPCQWVPLNSKATDTEVWSSNNQIQEIEIKGQNQAVRFKN